MYTLNFAHQVSYDAGLTGISLVVKLGVVGCSVEVAAKLDTGATDCIFARRFGEQLGFDIEAGEPVRFGTAPGSFLTFRHYVTLAVRNYEFDVGVCFADDDYFDRNVLGRFGLLDRILLGLNDYEGQLYLHSLAEL